MGCNSFAVAAFLQRGRVPVDADGQFQRRFVLDFDDFRERFVMDAMQDLVVRNHRLQWLTSQ